MTEITRRKFLKTGAKGAVLISVPYFFRLNPMAVLAAPEDDLMSVSDYFQHFGVNGAIIREVMETALSRGGNYCDLFFQHSINTYIGLEDDVVSRASTSVDFGVGIRVLKDDQTGYSFTEEITPEAMKLAARTAANIASGPAGTTATQFSARIPADYYPIRTSWESVEIDKRIPLIQKAGELAQSKDSRIVKTRAYLSDGVSYMLLATSEGVVSYDYQPMMRISISCTAEQNGKRENGSHNLSGRRGIEFITDDKIEYMTQKAVDQTVGLFDAVKPEAGEMPVVLAAGSSGILLHEAIGHGMEADFNRKGTSIFADKMGKKVAENFVSIVDDGTNQHMRGSINIDDEGNESQKTVLVENGILRSYLHDQISSRYYKVKPTGNGRRQSFRHQPLPRMRNTYMLPGPYKKEEIIASVKKGIFAETFAGGQVNIGPGDFSFYVKTGFLIEEGKVTRPVKDINIIGNGPEVLGRISMVADDFKFAEGGWTCGKSGQRVPVSVGLPSVLVSSITVGGVN
ncbi:MAG: metallopeptidase TldD-related protein [candidate division Zixibacteria bacterium]